MTVLGQPQVNYAYDIAGRLSGISTTITPWGAPNFSITNDDAGRRTALILPNGITTSYDYDTPGNNLQTLTHKNAANVTVESLNYSYDATGNRLSMTRPGVTIPLPKSVTTASYDEGNRQLTLQPQGGTAKIITYDDNGNSTSVTDNCGTTNYTWNARNQLAGITGYKPDCTALTATFKYDALGRRIEKTINNKTTNYLYDGLNIVQEFEGGNVTANYLGTGNTDEQLARIKTDGTIRYYQRDGLGSVIALTDNTGAIKTQYAYDPFGNTTATGEASDNPFQFTGRENDGTGLYYYRARYYNPGLQRFISEDPIGFSGGINYFAYVQNNPVNYTDPTGQFIFLPFLAAGGYTATMALADLTIAAAASWWLSHNLPTPPSDPAQSPGDGWEWRGKDPLGGRKGSWTNPGTGESMHPDLNHPEPIGPHWDYIDPEGKKHRLPCKN